MGDIYRIREFGFLEKGMDLMIARQNVVASNVANISTPGYKAKKIEFEKQMNAAIGGGFSMKETHPKHLPNNLKGIHGVKPAYKVELSGAREDGNTVNLDKETLTSAENTTKYDLFATVWSKHLRNIMMPFDGVR